MDRAAETTTTTTTVTQQPDDKMIDLLTRYEMAKREDLAGYDYFIDKLRYICAGVQCGELTDTTGRACAEILAGGRQDWKTGNIEIYEREIDKAQPDSYRFYTVKDLFRLNTYDKETIARDAATLPAIPADAGQFTPTAAEPRRHHKASELIRMDLPKIEFYIDQIIMEGIGWLAGEPKVGKSFMAMQMALDIAEGMPFLMTTEGIPFDGYETKQATVIYYSLEMDDQLVQQRLRSMRPSGNVPDDLIIYYDLPRLDEGGLEALETDIVEHDAKVIFIDVHGLVSGSKTTNTALYEETYEEIAALRKIATRQHCSIILLTHLNKDIGNSKFNRMMGSTANRGAADFNLILFRDNEGQRILTEESRKSEDIEIVMKWNHKPTRFNYIATTDEQNQDKRRREYDDNPVVRAIRELLRGSNRVEALASDIRAAMPDYYQDEWKTGKIGKEVRKLIERLKFYDGILTDTDLRIGSNPSGFRFWKSKETQK